MYHIMHVRVLIKPKQINYIQLTRILTPGQNAHPLEVNSPPKNLGLSPSNFVSPLWEISVYFYFEGFPYGYKVELAYIFPGTTSVTSRKLIK